MPVTITMRIVGADFRAGRSRAARKNYVTVGYFGAGRAIGADWRLFSGEWTLDRLFLLATIRLCSRQSRSQAGHIADF